MLSRRNAGRRAMLALILVAGLGAVAPGASASCAGPELRVSGAGGEGPSTVWVGEPAQVRGTYFLDGCGDAVSVSEGGCSAHTEREKARPSRDVALELRQRGRVWPLGEGDADDRGRIVWSVTVPAHVRPGRAVLVAGPARIPIAVGARH